MKSLHSATLEEEVRLLNDAIISIKKEMAIVKASETNFQLEILGDRLVVL